MKFKVVSVTDFARSVVIHINIVSSSYFRQRCFFLWDPTRSFRPYTRPILPAIFCQHEHMVDARRVHSVPLHVTAESICIRNIVLSLLKSYQFLTLSIQLTFAAGQPNARSQREGRVDAL